MPADLGFTLQVRAAHSASCSSSSSPTWWAPAPPRSASPLCSLGPLSGRQQVALKPPMLLPGSRQPAAWFLQRNVTCSAAAAAPPAQAEETYQYQAEVRPLVHLLLLPLLNLLPIKIKPLCFTCFVLGCCLMNCQPPVAVGMTILLGSCPVCLFPERCSTLPCCLAYGNMAKKYCCAAAPAAQVR